MATSRRLPFYVDFYVLERFKIDDLVLAPIGLAGGNEGFATMRQGEVARGAIVV